MTDATTGFRSTDYDAIAPRYDEERQAWEVPPDDVVQTFDASKRADVLDLGCGTGNYLAAQVGYFSDQQIRWFGIDPSLGMLDIAAKKVASARFVRGRAEQLPFGPETFDYVFTGWVFHHVDDKPAALTEIARVLMPGGRLRIRNVDPWSMRGWWPYRFFPSTWPADQARFWPVDRLGAALKELGLTVGFEIERRTGLPGVEVLSLAQRRVVSQLAAIDDASYREGLDRLKAHILADPDSPADDGVADVRLTATKPR